ncbi:MAG: sigma 54-interacting transcriptional regulator [Sandaracinaceae bacterium]
MASDAETTMRPAAAEKILGPIVHLKPLFEPGTGRSRPALPLGRKAFPIGRSIEGVGLTLRDPLASRLHAILHPIEGTTRVTVEDRSSNGTFVNGGRVHGSRELRDNDLIRIGGSFLLIRHASPLPEDDPPIPELVGNHPDMRALRRTIHSVSPTDAKVLILGESGTGKELVARAIHERSGRAGRFVAVNCGAIPEALAESQLFGHVPGAFTGAQGPHEGFMRAAEGGTLFLDEIGELSNTLQPKLLRALEESMVVPVGSTSPVSLDVRLVCATHRDLIAEVDAGNFRGDLYARIAGYLMATKPLRERREDILPLLRTFLGPEMPPPSADLVEALLLHPFRFNVRELKEIATQLRIDGAGLEELPLSLIELRLEHSRPEIHVPPDLGRGRVSSRPPPSRSKSPPPERAEVERLLEAHDGNVSRVARALGRSRRQVYRYIEQYGIDVPPRE